MTEEQVSTKHTPGPWEVSSWEAYGRRGRHYTTVAADAGVVARLYVNDYTEANARLIAAAPALLAALVEVCDTADRMLPAGHRGHDPECQMCAAVRAARQAIALATGNAEGVGS